MVHKHEKGSGSVAKRLLGLCLALVMLCGVFVPTFASVAGVDDQQPQQEQTEQQPAAPAEDANTGDEGEKKDDAGNVSGDAKDESENTGDSTGDTGDGEDANKDDAKDENTGDVKDDTTGDGETKDEAKDESKDAKDEDVKDADEPEDAADANAANGIATYAMPDVVTDGIANNSNIQVNMFNYDKDINKRDANNTVLRFYNYCDRENAYKAKDDVGSDWHVTDENSGAGYYGAQGTCSSDWYYHHDKIGRVLQNGYPMYEGKSMQYLFNANAPEGTASGGVTHYTAQANSGLFQMTDDGYLEYDSAKNAAYFNPSTKQFVLYDGVVRPYYTVETTDPIGTNFLPFNSGTQFIEDTSSSTLSPTRYKLGDGQVDLWFGMTVEFEFLMPEGGQVNGKDMTFEFKGDDDVLVFIDDVLVLDIGDTHGALEGTINFKSGTCNSTLKDNTASTNPDYYKWNSVTQNKTLKQLFTEANKTWDSTGNTFADYTTHKLKFFYLERGGNISYCKLKFNMPTLPSKALLVGKELTTNDKSVNLTNYLKDTYTYKFRVLKAGDLKTSYVTPGKTEYALVDKNSNPLLDENKQPRKGTVDADGYIYLKAGEYALFDNMAQYGGKDGPYDYVVEETLPTGLTGQYEDVEYTIGAGTGQKTTENTEATDFTGYRTGSLSALHAQFVVYNNIVDIKQLGKLSIKKIVTGDGAPADTVFTMNVTLDGKPLAAGTEYKIGDTVCTVSEGNEGKITLKADQTAVIENILAGTTFEVTEDNLPENSAYKFTLVEIKPSDYATDANGNKIIGVGGNVTVTVTNKYTPKTTTVTVEKIVAGNLGDKSKEFKFTWEYTVNNVKSSGDFTLTNYDQTKNNVFELKDVPIGATVIVKENKYTGYETTWVVSDGKTNGDGTDASFTASATEAENTITFTNTKDAEVDNGVFLDSMPYIMALVIVAGGAAVFFLRRRKKSED